MEYNASYLSFMFLVVSGLQSEARFSQATSEDRDESGDEV